MSDLRFTTLTEKVRGIMRGPATVLDADIDSDWYVMKLQDELHDMTKKYLAMTGRARTAPSSKIQAKKEFAAEMSEVLCLTLLLADRCKVKLDHALTGAKRAYAK